ncbi:MAG: flagellar basal body-associated FliL family protein [Pseudomonadota bacterium]|nr:flagellar basal body-associated FliL family protein [Pseudomonadota bacterium]
MAENKASEAEKPERAVKGKLKLIILLVVIVILAVGLSVAGTLWFLENRGADTEEDAAASEPEFVPSQYLVLEKSLTTTVPAQDRQRYAQIYVALEARDAEALAAAELHMPLLRSRLISTISNTDFARLRTPEGRGDLVDDMLAAVNQALEAEGSPPVEAVLLRNFVLQ